MPSGIEHEDVWSKQLKLVPVFAILVFLLLEYTLVYKHPYSCIVYNEYCFTNSLLVAVGIPLGYLLGKWVTPDLDQSNITKTEWDAMRSAKLLGVIFVQYWLPYGYLMKHRSQHSHSYVWSSFLRMIYMFWWIIFLHPVSLVLFILFGIFLGLSASDGIHIFLDRRKK